MALTAQFYTDEENVIETIEFEASASSEALAQLVFSRMLRLGLGGVEVVLKNDDGLYGSVVVTGDNASKVIGLLSSRSYVTFGVAGSGDYPGSSFESQTSIGWLESKIGEHTVEVVGWLTSQNAQGLAALAWAPRSSDLDPEAEEDVDLLLEEFVTLETNATPEEIAGVCAVLLGESVLFRTMAAYLQNSPSVDGAFIRAEISHALETENPQALMREISDL